MNSKKHFLKNNSISCIIFIAIAIILLPQCGRKKKDIFSFPAYTKNIKVNKLELPAPQEISIVKTNNANVISWSKIDNQKGMFLQKNHSIKILGYNVYRFLKNRFIPRNPINKKPVAENSLTDFYANKKHHFCYLVRAVFSVDKQILEGPASQIICI